MFNIWKQLLLHSLAHKAFVLSFDLCGFSFSGECVYEIAF